MKRKLKPELDLESIQADLIETVCFEYKPGVSVRALAKQFEMSPMKIRKILITGGAYSTDLSTEIGELWRDGKTVPEIAELLSTTAANVNSYLPYERIVYNMDEKSVEADRQARYRERKKAGIQLSEEGNSTIDGIEKTDKIEMLKKLKKIERVRTKTMIIVIGKKLRTILPKNIYDDVSDPLSREAGNWMAGGDWRNPIDPDRMIWCAEVTTSGRGKNKKRGVVLMNANCGFTVISPLPEPPALLPIEGTDYWEKRQVEDENRERVMEYRTKLETAFLEAIRDGFLKFCLPEARVADYVDTVARIELVRGKISTPGRRVEEMIKQYLDWSDGEDPVKNFNIRSNWTTRKFGNSGEYRQVDAHTCFMLGMNEVESRQWIFDFLAPMRERMSAEMGVSVAADPNVVADAGVEMDADAGTGAGQ